VRWKADAHEVPKNLGELSERALWGSSQGEEGDYGAHMTRKATPWNRTAAVFGQPTRFLPTNLTVSSSG